jgi:hypothetical protein
MAMKKAPGKWFFIITNVILAYVLASMIVRLIIFILTSFLGISKKLVLGNGLNPIQLSLTFAFISLLVFSYWMFSKITPRLFMRFSKKQPL